MKEFMRDVLRVPTLSESQTLLHYWFRTSFRTGANSHTQVGVQVFQRAGNGCRS